MYQGQQGVGMKVQDALHAQLSTQYAVYVRVEECLLQWVSLCCSRSRTSFASVA